MAVAGEAQSREMGLLLMKCLDCAQWIIYRKTRYGDGSEVITFQAPDGKGHCSHLNIVTEPNFGCTYFLQQLNNDHVVWSKKDGAPWAHWVMGDCPDCQAKGSNNDSACHRCAGTSKVRYYDDGFVGDERTRKHSQEGQVPVAADPGTRLNAPVKKEPFAEGSQF